MNGKLSDRFMHLDNSFGIPVWLCVVRDINDTSCNKTKTQTKTWAHVTNIKTWGEAA